MPLYTDKNEEDQIKNKGAGLRFYLPVNSYGHVETASSPNYHTFFLGKLD